MQLKTVSVQLPDNDYEKVMYIDALLKEIEEIRKKAEVIKEELMVHLSEDETHRVVPVFDARKSTDILEEEFKEELPDLYKKCLSISPANAVKIIGDDDIMRLCLKYGGAERTYQNSKLTLKNMKKYLSDDEYAKYTREYHKEIGKTVELK